MKRSGPLPRRTPLVARNELTRKAPLERDEGLSASVPLARAVPLQRTASMPQRPTRRQRDRAKTWAEVTDEAWEAWGRRCAVHGTFLPRGEVHGHHRRMRSAGGRDTVANCLPVCTRGHRAIHAGGTASYDAGLLVHPWDDPEDVEVQVP